MSCRHPAPRGRKGPLFPPAAAEHAHTHAQKTPPLCVGVHGSAHVSVWMCCIITVCLWAGVACQPPNPTPSPPSQSALDGFYWSNRQRGHTHTHSPWSQADRDRQRLGEVERTARGCLQTTGNTPPSHKNTGVEAKKKDCAKPLASLC